MDLMKIDLLEFFKIISAKMNVTIIPSKNVKGRINMFLNNVTFEDALDLVVSSQDLAMVEQENTIRIMTSSEYEKIYGAKYNEKRKFKAVRLVYAKPQAVFAALGQLKSEVGKIALDEPSATLLLYDTPQKIEMMVDAIREIDQPLETKVFDLQYAKPEEIKTEISAFITPGVGEMVGDARTTKLVVTDLPEKMEKISRIVKEFDVETLQVLIKAQILQITTTNEFQQQINWQAILNKLENLSIAGTFPAMPIWAPSVALSQANQLISIGQLSTNNYTLALQFLQTLGEVKVMSQPSILVVNGQEARLMVGSRQAYVIESLSQAVGSTLSAENIQFIDVGVKLNVVPTINRNGFVTLKIKPEVSNVASTLTTALGSTVPIVDTAGLETVVKIKEGNILVIGGLFQKNDEDRKTGVPGLVNDKSNILLGSRADLKAKTEVVVLLAPYIIKGDVSTSANDLAQSEAYKAFPEVSKIPFTVSEPIKPNMNINNMESKLKGIEDLE
jgi:type II secretory pathway component GspD/PulD (secretin)